MSKYSEQRHTLATKIFPKAILEMRLKKDLIFLRDNIFRTNAGLAEALGVTAKSLRDWIDLDLKMQDKSFHNVFSEVLKIKKWVREVEEYEPEKYFTGKIGGSND
jgi:hypothetical protein